MPLERNNLPQCFLTFLLVLFFVQTAFTQYKFDSFTTDNGLPQNGVRGIEQTPDGYLWFTTFDGLVRFDGVHFTVFDKNNTKGIAGNRFTMLTREADGVLLAGTEDGGLTVYQNGIFRTLTTVDGLPSNTLGYFRRDLTGKTVILADNRRFNYQNGQISGADKTDIPDNGFNYFSPTGNFWYYENNQIHQITPDKQHIIYPIKIEFFNEGLSGIKAFEDGTGNLWFGDLSGVYILKDGSFSKLTEANGVPKDTLLRPFVEDESGGIWFASGWERAKRYGLVRYFQGQFSVWAEDAGLSNLNTKQVFKDREGTIWTSTDKGLNHLRKQFITPISKAQGLIYNEVYPLLQAKNGDIFIGTTQGLMRSRNGQITDLNLRQTNGDKISVTSLFEDEKSRLWIGSTGELRVLEVGKLRIIPELSQKTVWAIKNDSRGNLWIASEKGLFKFRDDKFIAKFTTTEGLPSDDVKVIREDRNGVLWFGTYGGLVKFENDKFTVFTIENGLASNRVRSIYEDDHGVLWIGTYDGGLSRFADDKFFNYTLENGLFSNGVFQIFEDAKRNFWISCNKGIYRVNRDELEDFAAGKVAKINSIAYGKSDGMLSTETNGGRQPAGIKLADGKFWFPTQDGVAVINPNDVSFNPIPPQVQIEKVLINHTETDFNDGISLQANADNLEISYTGISFINSEQVKFRYRIEGLDESWVDVNTRRDVYFPVLSAGEYKFRVIAANSDGVWNEQGATLAIKVLPQFWQTWQFLFSTIFLVGFIAYFAYRRRIGALQKANFAKETFARQLIDSQENERRRIAAELHDSLGQSLILIKNWALLGLRAEQKQTSAKENLVEISETASDAIKEVREIAYNLGPFQLERLGLRNTIIEMIQKVGDSSTIIFTSEIDEIDGIFAKDAEVNIFRIVQEAINNIVKHSAATTANLRIEKDVSQIILTISDTGKGFVAETSDKNRGFGLLGMTERVNLLKGEFSIKSEAGNGTTVRVILPF